MARKLGDTGQAAVLDGSQIKRLIKISQTTNRAQRDQTVVVLSYWLGLRAKELASLKIGDVYLPDGSVRPVLHLKASYTKRAKVRDVYLSSDKIQRRLKEYWCHLSQSSLRYRSKKALGGSSRAGSLAGHQTLPCQRGWSDADGVMSYPLSMTRTRNAFKANGMVHLLKHLHALAGIDGGSSHSGRRTMITRLAEAGVDLKSIATLAGHSSIRTTAGYVEANPGLRDIHRRARWLQWMGVAAAKTIEG